MFELEKKKFRELYQKGKKATSEFFDPSYESGFSDVGLIARRKAGYGPNQRNQGGVGGIKNAAGQGATAIEAQGGTIKNVSVDQPKNQELGLISTIPVTQTKSLPERLPSPGMGEFGFGAGEGVLKGGNLNSLGGAVTADSARSANGPSRNILRNVSKQGAFSVLGGGDNGQASKGIQELSQEYRDRVERHKAARANPEQRNLYGERIARENARVGAEADLFLSSARARNKAMNIYNQKARSAALGDIAEQTVKAQEAISTLEPTLKAKQDKVYAERMQNRQAVLGDIEQAQQKRAIASQAIELQNKESQLEAERRAADIAREDAYRQERFGIDRANLELQAQKANVKNSMDAAKADAKLLETKTKMSATQNNRIASMVNSAQWQFNTPDVKVALLQQQGVTDHADILALIGPEAYRKYLDSYNEALGGNQ